MSEKTDHDLDQRRVRRLEQAIASGDREAIRRAGGQRGPEVAEARKRLQVRRVAREQREKRAAEAKATAEQKAQSAEHKGGQGKEQSAARSAQQGQGNAVRTSPAATRGQTAQRSSTPMRDAAIDRQKALAAQRQRDRADVRSR
ncbi:hypothetical protein [Gordonia desulfuricans]|uniref:hypothetical protein n=1 Tax=Gordonia desulfuricans TaxID=89051 RepID=UPI00073E273A|nr:hypothetical protein [Gordonia desulfuricans]